MIGEFKLDFVGQFDGGGVATLWLAPGLGNQPVLELVKRCSAIQIVEKMIANFAFE